ncbi:MAG: T9SS type A sorting domain-containing protein [Candidatus Symbiothrix sp.]|nr:T9SS type A sorting domain-containing protein [Candidatus Symbiothrix sp.]
MTISAYARNYYVKTDGNPALTGTSWNWASDNLQAMIEKASEGDVVYVAAGVYYGGFYMKEGVTVRGGYTANPDAPEERHELMQTSDPAKQSILDGGKTQRVLTQLLPFASPTVWDGFVIQNGKPSAEFKTGSLIYSQTGNHEITGILYQYDAEARKGMMIGTEEMKTQWGGYGRELSGLPPVTDRESAGNDFSGAANTRTIRTTLGDQSPDFGNENNAFSGNYAAYWCDTLTAGGYTDWYLPSAGEWKEIYDAGLRATLKKTGKNIDYPYWSSSHAGNTLAWAFCFGDAYYHPALKYVSYTVTAVHAFETPENPDGIYFAGGGAFLKNNGILENCIIKNNESASLGGGVYVGRGGKLINCTVTGNEAPEGKEIYYEPVLSLEQIEDGQTLRIFPNPVRQGETVRIVRDASPEIPLNYHWANLQGAAIMKGTLKTGENAIAVPNQKGIFILKIHSENKHYRSKIIVN